MDHETFVNDTIEKMFCEVITVTARDCCMSAVSTLHSVYTDNIQAKTIDAKHLRHGKCALKQEVNAKKTRLANTMQCILYIQSGVACF